MIRITDAIALDESEITEHFIRSPGPGGQNVNTVCIFKLEKNSDLLFEQNFSRSPERRCAETSKSHAYVSSQDAFF